MLVLLLTLFFSVKLKKSFTFLFQVHLENYFTFYHHQNYLYLEISIEGCRSPRTTFSCSPSFHGRVTMKTDSWVCSRLCEGFNGLFPSRISGLQDPIPNISILAVCCLWACLLYDVLPETTVISCSKGSLSLSFPPPWIFSPLSSPGSPLFLPHHSLSPGLIHCGLS